MLEDAAGIRRVVIACGYVDLRKGIDGLSMIIGVRPPLPGIDNEGIFTLRNVADGPTASRDFYGWETVFFSSTNGWRQVPCPGREPAKRPQTLQRNSSVIL